MTDIFIGISQEVISGVALGSIYALIALGFTMIYKATEVVNFAQGDLMMVGAYANFFFVSTFLSIVESQAHGPLQRHLFAVCFFQFYLVYFLILLLIDH